MPLVSHETAESVISHVLELSGREVSLVPSLRTVRDNQKTHETAWHAARDLIVRKYETKRTLNTLLTAAGGSAGLGAAEIDEAETHDLREFDRKVRLAMGDMWRGQMKELETLGVPILADEEEMRRVTTVLEELMDAVPRTATSAGEPM